MNSGFFVYWNNMRTRLKTQFVIGIDEVGRGPLAGPVAVGAVVATKETLRRYRKIKESKQLTPSSREEWHARITKDLGPTLCYAVSYVSAKKIDEKGVTWAIRHALAESLRKLNIDPNDCVVLLDGGLYAPPEYKHQETIIRGDAKETVIAMASVMAKVERDRRMVTLHKKIPAYGFSAHKGYGTREHIRAIKEHGPSSEHRRSFLRNILPPMNS
jgi:ribonuclease HII